VTQLFLELMTTSCDPPGLNISNNVSYRAVFATKLRELETLAQNLKLTFLQIILHYNFQKAKKERKKADEDNNRNNGRQY
jgi:hypothetical protein